MRVQSALEADAQLAKAGEPRVGSLDNPAVSAQAVLALDALARNA